MKYAVVTGAYGGMGYKTTLELVNNGYIVFALDKNVKNKEENIIPIEVDVSNLESVKNAFIKVKEITDTVESIIHFAGIYRLNSLIEIDENEFDKICKINLYGAFYINKTFMPLLKKGSKIIITTSELAPLDPLPFTGVYAVTKGALDKYAYSLRMELQLLDISVSVIRAGAVETDMLDVSTEALNNFCNETALYKFSSTKFKDIVYSVEANKVPPLTIAKKVVKIINAKNPKFIYNVNRNKLLLLLNALPKRLQCYAIKKILK